MSFPLDMIHYLFPKQFSHHETVSLCFLFYHKSNIHSISDILFLVPVTCGSNTKDAGNHDKGGKVGI